MTYTALALVFMLVCVVAGCVRANRIPRGRLAALLASVMVAAQFAVLMLK
jgi:hypothetical protein